MFPVSQHLALAQAMPNTNTAPASLSPSVEAASVQRPIVLPADLPLRRDSDEPLMGTVGYLIWLLGAAAAITVLWAVRSRRVNASGWLVKLRPAGHERALKLLATRALGPNSSLQVVQWNGKELLLGCTAQSISVLDAQPVSGTPPEKTGGAGVPAAPTHREAP